MQLDINHIVCGRGQSNYNNEGNRIYRQVVASRLSSYMDKCTRRRAKTMLVNETTQKLIQMKMVFVKRSKSDRRWVTLTPDQARKKVAHLFRDGSRKARCRSIWKSFSSSAGVVPAATDSDESWSTSSLLTSTVDPFLATRSDTDCNNMVSSRATTSDSEVEDTAGVGSVSLIAEMVTGSGERYSSQKPEFSEVINWDGSLLPHTLAKIEFSDAMENDSNEVQILPSRTHNSLMMSGIIQELEAWEMLDDNEVCCLSNVEHLEDRHSLTADYSACESDLDTFLQDSTF
jgi:hypothetical protein